MRAALLFVTAALAVQWGILLGLGFNDSALWLMLVSVAGLIADGVSAGLIWRHF